jgi:hypothetical protein
MEQEKSSSVGRFTSAAPKTDTRAKDLFALITVGIVGLIAAALLALAFHLAVQEEPESAPLATSNDSVTQPADMASSSGVSKRFTDRLPSEGEAGANETSDSQASASAGKRFTDRLPSEEETDASSEDGPAPAAGGKKITDRIIGETEIGGE